jgi:hypothetical protein
MPTSPSASLQNVWYASTKRLLLCKHALGRQIFVCTQVMRIRLQKTVQSRYKNSDLERMEEAEVVAVVAYL